jgi:murein DD-endopeptidase MepM/ murein hydrolase activator NlpD
LAGGLNLYGFANGDPVNFSDPFGLCPAYLTGRPCLTPLVGASGPLRLRPDGKGGFDAPRRGARPHGAADLSTPLGSDVGAADHGVVVNKSSLGDAGNHLVIGHFNDRGEITSFTVYAHLSSFADGVKIGGFVKAGQVIGQSGDTGNAQEEPPHLHFEIRTERRGGNLDPMKHIITPEEKENR